MSPRRSSGGHALIAREDPVARVALVAAEDLVASVPGQEPAHAAFPGQLGAEVGADGRVVPERLVVGLDETGEEVQRLVRGDDVLVVGGAELLRGQVGEAQLVVALLTEPDGEGVHALAAEPGHVAKHRAAVGAAGQKGARLLDRCAGQRRRHRLLHHLPGRGLALAASEAPLGILHVPERGGGRLAVPDAEKVAGREPVHALEGGLRARGRSRS